MRADEPCVHEREATFPLGRFFFHASLPCAECAAEEHAAWVESVRGRLIAGLKAAAAGEPFAWTEPDPDDGARYAVLRYDDRLDLALTVGPDGRCTVPAAGRYGFPELAALRDVADQERISRRLREGTMTLTEARAHYLGLLDPIDAPFPDGPPFPEGMGAVLHAVLNSEAQPGLPFVHTVRLTPDCDLEDCCDTDDPCGCACHRSAPTMTLEAADA